ncbi:uncharacterized protein LOC111068468 [Drosophila obscura]|uniref:uncharacterized protein LOC111068468 n=1 Tax=Drosophila obscura TaxID=7282 RepID=UPI000B9FFF34|nr:uncharacterized protein LOC111068468 [Drosophila obscura]
MKISAKNKNTMLKNPKIVKISPATAAKSFDVAHVCSGDLESDGGVRLPPLTLKSRIKPEDVVGARFRPVEARSKAVVLTDRQFDAHMKRLVKVFMAEVSITRDMREITSKRSLQPADRLLLQDLDILKGKFRHERSNLVVTLSMDSRHRSQQSSATEIGARASNKNQIPDEKPSDSSDDAGPSTSRMSKLLKRPIQSRKRGGAQPKVTSNPPIICKNIVTPIELSNKLMEKLVKGCKSPILPEQISRKLRQRFAHPTESPEANVLPPSSVDAPKTDPTNAPASTSVARTDRAKSKELSAHSSDIFYDFPTAVY